MIVFSVKFYFMLEIDMLIVSKSYLKVSCDYTDFVFKYSDVIFIIFNYK